eukprot:TRINITY_DN256_c0_g1_i2.p5 TRINITY_DN256_c0_g1~~TRINITY_DN256_c0_g1_i2.p5  ORF type:complete len:107 (+),score=17.68 TRINITY_DN256_c0_g1_i2:23-343(+)
MLSFSQVRRRYVVSVLCFLRGQRDVQYVHLVFFLNDTATTEIYTILFVGSVRCVQETGTWGSSEQEFTVDALEPPGDEGRGKLRKAAGRSTHPVIRRLPNGVTRLA